jgi:hypothetical protein
VSEPAALEWRYRRLLAWYPRSFRRQQEDEMLAVLMAGARPGQRRPGLLEIVDVLRSALGMRLVLAITSLRTGRSNQRWTDALALFSVAAPVFLVIVAILEVAVPYHLPPGVSRLPLLARPVAMPGGHEIGGLSLLSVPFFDVAFGLQVIVAAFALLGWRRLTLTAMGASVLYWIVYAYGIFAVPDALQLLAASAYILGAAALFVSSGPRRGRQLMNWRLWAVLLAAAAFVQASTLLQYPTSPLAHRLWNLTPPDTSGYLVLSVVFGISALALAVALKLNRHLLLLLAAMFYPYAMQLAFSGTLRPASANLLRNPTPGNLAVLFVPPLLLAGWAMLTAVRPRRSRFMTSPGQEG